MKRTALALLAAAAFTAPAAAQDFSGPYLGIGLGARQMDADWTTTELQAGPAPSSGFWEPSTANHTFESTNFRVNGMFGWDWQTPTWVFGVEAQAGWGDSSDELADTPGQDFVGATPAPNDDLLKVESEWDLSLTGRAGFVSGGWLIFGVAGIASQQFEVSLDCPGTNSWCIADRYDVDEASLTGWVAGVGVERAFGSWRWRADYRYADLGDFNVSFFDTAPVDQVGGNVEVTHQSLMVSLIKPL